MAAAPGGRTPKRFGECRKHQAPTLPIFRLRVFQQALTTIVNAQEVTQGWCALLNRLPSGDSEVRAYSQFGHSLKLLMELPVLPFDLKSSETFDRLRSAHRKTGRMDLKIASICIVNDLLLLTRNLSDFQDLAGLRFENWLD
jgi:tRNA(fMet)-specific endonuclease VapC